MSSHSLLAVQKLNIDPDTLNAANLITGFFYVAGLVVIIGLVVKTFAPIVYENRKQKLAKRVREMNLIHYDSKESQLRIGYNQLRIEPMSYEHYVCEIVLPKPNDFHNDEDIREIKNNYVENYDESERVVEQAVRRLNKKAIKIGLDGELFKRSKQRTSVNDKYRTRITK